MLGDPPRAPNVPPRLLMRTPPMEWSKALAIYEKLVATNPQVERKGDTMPYTSLNGNMFSVLHKDGTVALRLSPADNEAFRAKYKTGHPAVYGVVSAEYVVVPDALLAKTAELERHFEASFDYVKSLKPKATTRKKAAGKKKGK
jgi:hypothetical protein